MLRQAARRLAQSALSDASAASLRLTSRLSSLAYPSCTFTDAPQPSASGRSSGDAGRAAGAALVLGVAACSFATSAVADAPAQGTISSSTAKKPVILYQYEICPYCCKVKAALDYFNIPYQVVEVNPLTKAELKFSEYKKVPVLMTPSGEQLNDSSTIITQICKDVEQDRPQSKGFWSSKKAVEPATGEEAKWRAWVDATFVKLVTANIYSSWGQSFQTMKYITESGSWGSIERALAYNGGAVLMYAIGSRMPKKYGFEGDLRVLLYKELDTFIDSIGNNNFAGGKEPNLADLAVFGVIRAIQNTDTFYDMLENSRVKPWWFRMIDAVGESSRLENKVEV